MRLILRLLLSALAFTTLLPQIPGIEFHGGFWAAIWLSIAFGVILWAVEAICLAIAAIWTMGTLGLALLWILPIWIFGFWLLPAFAFMITAAMLPQYLTVSGFVAAALAGLVMLGVGFITSKVFWGANRRQITQT